MQMFAYKHFLHNTYSLNELQIHQKSGWRQSTIKSVKQKYADKQGTPPEKTRLVFKGKLFVKGRSMQDYNTEEGMTLHSTIMLRGGGNVRNTNIINSNDRM